MNFDHTLTEYEAEATLRVLQTVYDTETDHDHKHEVRDAMAVLVKRLDDDATLGGIVSDPTKKDVETALDVLGRDGEAYGGLDDDWGPKNDLQAAFDFVDTSAQYANSVLPEPRDWEVVYKDTSSRNTLEIRDMEYADSEPTRPMIDGKPYDCDRTEWDDQTFIVYVEQATPEPDAFAVSCWDCDLDESADTEAEAQQLCTEHQSNNAEHNAVYSRDRN